MGVLIIPLLDDDSDSDSNDDEIRGTLEDDQPLNGTEGADTIFGFAGDDIINAEGGDDTVRAGFGNDVVNGGDGRDFIFGFDGDDTLNGENGADRIQGGEGADRIDGGRNADDIDGGPGNDTLIGGAPAIRGPGGELIIDTLRRDDVDGDDGDDTLFIWGGRGEAEGGEGDDDLVLVTGQGTLSDEFGGQTDFFILANAEDSDIPTRGTITEFNPMEDTLTLTVDANLADGETPPDVTFTLEARSVMEGEQVVNGIFVKAVLAEGEDPIEGSEGAGVFLRGASLEELEGADIEVVFTNGADYFDPETTLANVIAARPSS